MTASLTRSKVEQLQPRHSELAQSLVPRRARALIDHHTAHLAGAEACLFAFTPNGDALVAVHATSGLCRMVESLHVPAGAGVSGWVAGNRSTIRHADPVLDLGEIATSIGLTSCSSTPVFVAGEVFGALTVYRASDRAGAELASMMGTLAQEVGLAIARQADEPCYAPFAVSNTTAECTRSAS